MTQLSNTAFALKTQTAMKYPPTFKTCTPQAKQSPTGNILAVAATARISQWRHDAGVLEVPFFRSVLMQPTLIPEYLFVLGSLGAFFSGCQPGVRVVPSWSVFGSPPLTLSASVKWQEATDPQSAGAEPSHTEGAHSAAPRR